MWDEWRGGLEVSALTLKIENCHIKYEPQKTLPNVEIKASISSPSSKKEVNYTRLQNFLASGNWKHADQETRLIMLNIARREKEGWLDINSISNFKSTDLRTINQLWMKYSHGHFGFSIQKSIWQDVKNNAQAFSYRVGWRILGKWVYHHSLTFSLDALPGHLPFWGRGWCGEGQWVQEVQIGQWANALLSHQDL
ncbi:MAG: GUN4 domain-containing protein [Rhizonema sp. NSF051]|nr:GUN4 domain-containing protein [Rhizonema sp. NSF051]